MLWIRLSAKCHKWTKLSYGHSVTLPISTNWWNWCLQMFYCLQRFNKDIILKNICILYNLYWRSDKEKITILRHFYDEQQFSCYLDFQTNWQQNKTVAFKINHTPKKDEGRIKIFKSGTNSKTLSNLLLELVILFKIFFKSLFHLKEKREKCIVTQFIIIITIIFSSLVHPVSVGYQASYRLQKLLKNKQT